MLYTQTQTETGETRSSIYIQVLAFIAFAHAKIFHQRLVYLTRPIPDVCRFLAGALSNSIRHRNHT